MHAEGFEAGSTVGSVATVANWRVCAPYKAAGATQLSPVVGPTKDSGLMLPDFLIFQEKQTCGFLYQFTQFLNVG